MPDVLDQLLARPGLYTGPQADPADTSGAPPSAARIQIDLLPGGAGVRMDYEVLAPQGRVHWEQAMLARTSAGLVLVTAHTHAGIATVLHETDPGHFPAADGDAPFPMAIDLEAAEPGHLVYTWSYAAPGGELRVREIGDVRVVD